jgi:hypothetical protein
MPNQSHSSRFCHPNELDVQYSSLSTSSLHSPVSSSLFCPNILLNTLFTNTLRLRSSLKIWPNFHKSNYVRQKYSLLMMGDLSCSEPKYVATQL